MCVEYLTTAVEAALWCEKASGEATECLVSTTFMGMRLEPRSSLHAFGLMACLFARWLQMAQSPGPMGSLM